MDRSDDRPVLHSAASLARFEDADDADSGAGRDEHSGDRRRKERRGQVETQTTNAPGSCAAADASLTRH